MKEKTITIGYWHLHKYNELPYDHLEEIPYTEERLMDIINTVTKHNFSIMIRPFNIDNEMVIWIDKNRFGQK